MTKLGENIRQRIPADGTAAKVLSTIYVVWFVVLVSVINQVYSSKHHHDTQSIKTEVILTVLGILSWVLVSFLGLLHGNVYQVIAWRGKKRYRAYFSKLDERELQTRQRIFEHSYSVITGLVLLTVFVGSGWSGANLVSPGLSMYGGNMLVFILSVPTLVATWDKASPRLAGDNEMLKGVAR